MVQLDDDGTGERVLYAADGEVLEHYLFGLLGDDIRDDLDLPYLDLPTAEADTADRYCLGPLRERFAHAVQRQRARRRGALSHFLGHSLDNLRRSYLDEWGAPLLRGGRYAVR